VRNIRNPKPLDAGAGGQAGPVSAQKISAASFYLLQFQPANITQFACHI
jgi:hypothetical protein